MKRLIRSFCHALRGIGYTLRYERNFQVECAAAGAVIFIMFLLPLSSVERVILLLVIAFVLVLELVNTSVERIMDILKPRVHPYARVVKDVMAGAVLISSFAAILIGLLIFFPYTL